MRYAMVLLMLLVAGPAFGESVELRDTVVTHDGLVIPAGVPAEVLDVEGGLSVTARFAWAFGPGGAVVTDASRLTLLVSPERLRGVRPVCAPEVRQTREAPTMPPVPLLHHGGAWR